MNETLNQIKNMNSTSPVGFTRTFTRMSSPPFEHLVTIEETVIATGVGRQGQAVSLVRRVNLTHDNFTVWGVAFNGFVGITCGSEAAGRESYAGYLA